MTIIEFLKFINWQLFYVSNMRRRREGRVGRCWWYERDIDINETTTELNGNENFIENISSIESSCRSVRRGGTRNKRDDVAPSHLWMASTSIDKST